MPLWNKKVTIFSLLDSKLIELPKCAACQSRETQETWVIAESEDPWKMAIHSSILMEEISWIEDLVGYSPQCCKEWNTTEPMNMHAHLHKYKNKYAYNTLVGVNLYINLI